MTLRAEKLLLDAGANNAGSPASSPRTLLRDFTQTFASGELWAVLGQNGSGKTTLLHALSGLKTPASGSVMLDDVPLEQWSRRALARKAGVLLQHEPEMFWGDVRAYVALGRYAYGDENEACVNEALAAFDLNGLASHAYPTLSGGERQRARLAQLWAQMHIKPAFRGEFAGEPVMLLDEPTQHLDLKHQQQFFAQVRHACDAGKTALMVLHDPKPALSCDRVLLLYGDGRWRALAATEVTAQILAALYDCEIRF